MRSRISSKIGSNSNLNAVVAAVCYQNDAITILGDARWLVELARTLAILPNLQQRLSFIVRLETDTPACKMTDDAKMNTIHQKLKFFQSHVGPLGSA